MRVKTAFLLALSLLVYSAFQPHFIAAQSQMQQLNEMLSQMSLNSSFNSDKFSQLAANSSEQQRFLLYAKLRTYYCEKYLTENDTPLQNVAELINSFFPLDNRLGYFTFCTERQLINQYTDEEFNYFSQNDQSDKSEYDDLRYVLDLYRGLSLYKHNCANKKTNKNSNKNAIDDYSRCPDYLDTALSYKPNDSLYPILSDCLAKSRRFERLFYLECYRQYDRNNGSLLKTAQLFLLYKKIAHPTKKFSQLCESVKSDVLNNTIKRFEVSRDMPSAEDLIVQNTDGQNVHLIAKPQSQDKISTIVLFFSVTCHNCIDEMNTLSKMADNLQQRNINIVGIYTMFNNTQTAFDELKSFQTAHNYPFPTFIDPNRSSISSRYGITSVPSIMFVRDDGSLAGLGSLNHYGHLHEKFSALFSLFD